MWKKKGRIRYILRGSGRKRGKEYVSFEKVRKEERKKRRENKKETKQKTGIFSECTK